MIPKYILKHSQQAKAFGTNNKKKMFNTVFKWIYFEINFIIKYILNTIKAIYYRVIMKQKQLF